MNKFKRKISGSPIMKRNQIENNKEKLIPTKMYDDQNQRMLIYKWKHHRMSNQNLWYKRTSVQKWINKLIGLIPTDEQASSFVIELGNNDLKKMMGVFHDFEFSLSQMKCQSWQARNTMGRYTREKVLKVHQKRGTCNVEVGNEGSSWRLDSYTMDK